MVQASEPFLLYCSIIQHSSKCLCGTFSLILLCLGAIMWKQQQLALQICYARAIIQYTFFLFPLTLPQLYYLWRKSCSETHLGENNRWSLQNDWPMEGHQVSIACSFFYKRRKAHLLRQVFWNRGFIWQMVYVSCAISTARIYNCVCVFRLLCKALCLLNLERERRD